MTRQPITHATTATQVTVPAPVSAVRTAGLVTVIGRDGEEVTFTGYALASRSSHRDDHRHRGDFAPPGWRCGACRWIEVAVYRVTGDATGGSLRSPYLVHTRGYSLIPGETTRGRVAFADTPFDVLGLLTVWRGEVATLPETNAGVIEEAAETDPELSAAYDRWLEAGVQY